jgi:hypothetical protein
LVYSEWERRKTAEALNWQINKPNDDDDGGFCAEKPNDIGGVYTTAETLYVFLNTSCFPHMTVVCSALKVGFCGTRI